MARPRVKVEPYKVTYKVASQTITETVFIAVTVTDHADLIKYFNAYLVTKFGPNKATLIDYTK